MALYKPPKLPWAFRQITINLCLHPSVKDISLHPHSPPNILDIDPSSLSDRTQVISSQICQRKKNTSTDVNFIMCGRKSQEINGKRHQQLAAGND